MSSTAKNVSGKPVSLVWLRRDLRLYDHAAFAQAAKASAPVLPVFIFDTDILARFSHKQDRRLTLIAEVLCRMHQLLAKKESGVLVLHGRAEALIPKLCKKLASQYLFTAEDFEPATRQRDANVQKALGQGTQFIRVLDHLLVAPDSLLKSDGTPYKVFTPYSKAWRALAQSKPHFAEEALLKGLICANYTELAETLAEFNPLDPSKGAGAMLAAVGYEPQAHYWPVDSARKRLHEFAEKRMAAYNTQRNFMAQDGTSRLSPYLRFGLLSVRECARLAFDAEANGSAGASTWLNELIWRDFYAMILYHFPHTEKLEMQEKTRDIPWSYDEGHFRHFIEGKTGYPVVDAAMRELLTTGYMHNRARMIVASFMTKDLLLDWRMGEEHFAQHLMDYELSSNVGGWQWAASTGTDAQPYFRVFNPVLQSKKFDPDGEYIRRYVPELAHLAGDAIHEPWKEARPAHYPAPMVEHMAAKEKAVAAFRKVGEA